MNDDGRIRPNDRLAPALGHFTLFGFSAPATGGKAALAFLTYTFLNVNAADILCRQDRQIEENESFRDRHGQDGVLEGDAFERPEMIKSQEVKEVVQTKKPV